MRLFFDWEFIDTGNLLLPLSVGVVRPDAGAYYAEPEDTPIDEASEWVQANVIPLMNRFDDSRSKAPVKPRWQIAEELIEFAGPFPEWWAYVDEYDWVLLSQLYGSLVDRPSTWPIRARDVRELFDLAGMAGEPEDWVPPKVVHHALHDAQWDMDLFDCVQRYCIDHGLDALVLEAP